VTILADFICDSCGKIELDVWGEPDGLCCGEKPRRHYGNHFRNIPKDNIDLSATHDAEGHILRAQVRSDPLCKHELGLIKGAQNGVSTFSNDQRREYVGRLLKDGDSPKLRQEILATRARNQGKTYTNLGR